MSDRRWNRPVPRPPSGLGGFHVLLALVIFFGVVFAVNASLVAFALSTRSGVVAQEPYVKGLHYNARIAAGERQAQLGWHEDPRLLQSGHFDLSIRARDGSPVSNLDVWASVGRPSTARFDRELRLGELEPGRYRGDFGALEAGTWIVTAKAFEKTGNGEPVFRLRRRQWLMP